MVVTGLEASIRFLASQILILTYDLTPWVFKFAKRPNDRKFLLSEQRFSLWSNLDVYAFVVPLRWLISPSRAKNFIADASYRKGWIVDENFGMQLHNSFLLVLFSECVLEKGP